MAPHVQPLSQENADDSLMDDFDSVFGERSATNGYGSFLLATPTATHDESGTLINMKDILARKPQPISPTLPALEADLNSLQNDPLDLDPIPQSMQSPKRTKSTGRKLESPSIGSLSVKRSSAAKPRGSTDLVAKPRGSTDLAADPRGSTDLAAKPMNRCISSPKIASLTPMGNGPVFSASVRIKEHFVKMEALGAKEHFSDTLEEWKGLIGSFEKLETIESAKFPCNHQLTTICALTLAWIADHLVDLLLKRMQIKVATSVVEPDLILSQIAQVSALREQSRQSSMIFLTRRETFSAAHRLHSPLLGDDENRQIYGKCNWSGGHGHNYVLQVTVTGELDPRTGMLMNLAELKRIIREEALVQLDHRNIDRDVPFFVDNPSTVENVAIYIWQQLVDQMPAAVRLYEIKLIETESNWVVFRGHQ